MIKTKDGNNGKYFELISFLVVNLLIMAVFDKFDEETQFLIANTIVVEMQEMLPNIIMGLSVVCVICLGVKLYFGYGEIVETAKRVILTAGGLMLFAWFVMDWLAAFEICRGEVYKNE